MRIYFLTLCLGLSFNINAANFKSPLTGQDPDVVSYLGKEYIIQEYLMEVFFEKNPTKKPILEVESSALERGYVATFEIIQNQLYVVDIKILKGPANNADLKSVFDKIFPNKSKKKVNWKSGLLNISNGDYIYPKGYNNHLILELKRGKIKKKKRFNLEELNDFKNNQFLELKAKRKYRNIVKYLKTTKNIKLKNMDFIIRRDIFKYTNKIMVD